MKRLLSIVIVLTLLLGVLTSCELPFDLPFDLPFIGGDEADIQEVVKTLDDMYEDDNGKSIPDGYELIAQYKLGGTTFTITWTCDNANIKIDLVDGLYVVTLPKNTEGQSEYKLIATITSPSGKTATAEYNRVLAQSFGMITNPVAGTAYKLALLHGNEKAVVYFDGNNYNNYAWYFSYTTDATAAVDVYLETVEGVEDGYRLYFNKDGVKTYIVAFPRDGDTTKGTLKFDTVCPTEYFTYSTEHNTLVYTSVTGQQFFMGSSGTFKSISCSEISYLNNPTNYPARLYGVGGVEETLPEQTLPTIPDDYTSEDVVEALYKLLPGQTIEDTYVITGVVTSIKYAFDPSYNNVSVNIVVGNLTDKPVLLYRITGEGADTLKVGDTVTVRAGLTNYGGTFETTSGGVIENIVPGTGEVTPPTPGNLMTIPEVLASAEGTNVVVKGTVESFYYAWSDEYNNCSVYIKDDAGNQLLCFRLKTKVAIGDQITVTGTATVYNGTVQIAEGCTATIDVPAGGGSTSTTYGAPVEGTAYKLYMELPTGKVYFKGSLDAAKNSYLDTTTDLASGVEIFFEIVDGGYNIYFMNGDVKTYINAEAYLKEPNASGKVYAGCHFTLGTTATTTWTYDTTYGTLEVYGEIEGKSDTFFAGTYGTYTTISLSGVYYKDQIASGSQYPARLVLSDGTTPPAGEGSGSGSGAVTPPAVDENGYMTIPDILASAEGTAVKVKGTVCEIYQSWSDQHSNISFYIKDEAGNKLLVFRTGTQVKIGDQVTVTGTATVYNGTIQIAQGGVTVIDVAHVCSTFTEGSCTVDSYCAVCGALGTEAPGHNYVNGTCTVCNGAQPQGDVLPSNLTFTNLANNASADTYLKTNFPEWKITGKLGNGYGGYLGFGRSGDYDSAITSSDMSVSKAFTVTAVLKGNGSQGVATSTLTFTLVDADGNTIATGYADGSTTAAITPVDAKDTTYNISFTFVEGKTWTDVSNLVVTFDKVTGNIGMKSLTFVQ